MIFDQSHGGHVTGDRSPLVNCRVEVIPDNPSVTRTIVSTEHVSNSSPRNIVSMEDYLVNPGTHDSEEETHTSHGSLCSVTDSFSHETSVYDTSVSNHKALISSDVTTCDVTKRNGHVHSSPGDVILPPSSGSKHSICRLSRDGFETYTTVQS